MGNYIDADDVEERMGTPTYYNLMSKVSRDEVATAIANIISRAEAKVDMYIARSWEVPVPESGVVQEWAFRIVEYEMYKKAMGNDVPLKYKTSYEEVIKELKEAGAAIITIPDATRKTHGISLDVKSERALFTKRNFYGRDYYL
jgi:hypothetical protein